MERKVSSVMAAVMNLTGYIVVGHHHAQADVFTVISLHIVGMYALDWLMNRGVLPKSRSNDYYASYVAGIFRSVRFGVAEAHGRAEMMVFNYLSEQHAINREPSGRYAIDFARMPGAMASLAKELLEIEATGDRGRAERWFAKYDKMPDTLLAALAKTKVSLRKTLNR